MAVIATAAYLLTRFPAFRRMLSRRATIWEKLILALAFGLLAISGTYLGVEMKGGAIANSRVIGPAVGGLLGGPLVGVGAGLVGGIHRYFQGGFTAFSCSVSTVIEGLMAGLMHIYTLKGREPNPRIGFIAGIITESVQMIIILALARPFTAAVELVEVIALPMILVNSLGIAIFVSMIQTITRGEERIGAVHTHQVLKIANETLPFFRAGLSKESATKAAAAILEMTQADAVAITDREKILAHVGAGADHHLPGQPIVTDATRRALQDGHMVVAQHRGEVGCSHKKCPLTSGAVVPLRCGGEIVGALKLYQTGDKPLTSVDTELVAGMGQLIATQFELAALERQAQLTTKAELKALQAQINPHFLFNALNTIVSLVRTDQEMARSLLIQLGDLFRRTLRHSGNMVTLGDEVEHVEAYLAIEQARIGPRLRVEFAVDPALRNLKIPFLTLQPLVENAVKHGIFPKKDGGTIRVQARRKGGWAEIAVIDDGVGLDPALQHCGLDRRFGAKSQGRGGIGLSNVNERLKSLFGPDSGLQIASDPESGTSISFRLQINRKERKAV